MAEESKATGAEDQGSGEQPVPAESPSVMPSALQEHPEAAEDAGADDDGSYNGSV